MMSTPDSQLIEQLGKNPPWVAFVDDEHVKEMFSQIVTKDNMPTATIRSGEIMKIRSFLTSGIEPKIIIVDLSQSIDLLSDAKNIVSSAPAMTRFIIIGKDDHVSIFRDLKRIGIADYLILPIQEEDIRNAISDTLLTPMANVEDNTATLVKPFTVVVGARGGVGASTACVNLAWITANEFKKKVCLIDFDLHNSSICVLLDVAQNAGLNDAVNEIDRLDDIFLKRLLLQKEDNFSILTGHLGLEQEINLSGEAIRTLITLLRNNFDYMYADLPFSSLHTAFSQTILNLSDNVIIVTDLSLVSVQAVLRLKAFLTTYMPHLHCKIIANNIFPNGGTISKAMFEKATNLIIEDILPYCKANMLEGVNAGEAFVKTYPSHTYGKFLRKFITSLYPQLKPVSAKKPSLWERLWRLTK